MARLGQGVRKRTDGNLEKRFTINGKRYSVYGKTNKEVASKEQEIRNKIQQGIYTSNRNITLDRYFDEWIRGKRATNKPSTVKGYGIYYRKHIAPELGKRKVTQIEKREVQEVLITIADKVSNNASNYCLKILKMLFKSAMNDDIVAKDICLNIAPLKDDSKASETYHRALTEEEQKAFMQEVKSDYLYEFIAMLLCTGMRGGEVGALTWSDIDYKNNVIHVHKTLSFTEDNKMYIEDTTKSKAGVRDIPITETIKLVLASQREKMGNIISIDPKDTIFKGVQGGYVHNHAITRAIESALDRLDSKGIHIERFTGHALRDTFATRFIEQGGNPQTLKTLLGHSSLAMTMDLYAHVLPNTKQKEMDNLVIAL